MFLSVILLTTADATCVRSCCYVQEQEHCRTEWSYCDGDCEALEWYVPTVGAVVGHYNDTEREIGCANLTYCEPYAAVSGYDAYDADGCPYAIFDSPNLGIVGSDFWVPRFFIGSSIGWGVGTICIVLVSLPVCCGVKKESNNLRLIGSVVGMVAGFCNFIPIIAAYVINHMEYGHCTEQEGMKSTSLTILDWILVYTIFCGWFTVVLASVAEGLACCVCCPCCGPLKRYEDQQKGRALAAAPTVVGRPVEVAGCVSQCK